MPYSGMLVVFVPRVYVESAPSLLARFLSYTPIASARLASQLEEIVQVVELSGDELAQLTTLSN